MKRVSGRVSLVAAALAVASTVGSTAELEAQQAPGNVTVDSIAVEGNLRRSRAEILATAGLPLGTPISYRDVQNSIKSLWSTGQFEDIEVLASGGQGGSPVVLTFQVEEADRIRTVRFPGLENVDANEVREATGLRPGEAYSPQKVIRAKSFIRSELAANGIPFARIEEEIEPAEDAEKEIHLVLNVSEGNRVAVAEVLIEGNEEFSDAELTEAMATRPEGFLWFRGGDYDTDSYQTDVEERLPSFYEARGYLDFYIVDDTLVVDPETGKARVELTVDEGPQYRVGEFEIEGNEYFTTDQLSRYFRTETGGLLRSLGFGGGDDEDPVFDAVSFRDATNQVQRLYNNEGYLYARVQPFIEKMDRDEGEGDPKVRVGWRINENDPAYVNRIQIEGNDYTHERVIRDRILLLPGDVYSEDRLLQSFQSVQGLGYFEEPMQPPRIEPDPETGNVDITFQVEERQTGAINFGTAVGGGTGLSGFIGYDQPNLFGQGKQGSLRWDFGRFINSFTATYSDPALIGPRVSGTFSAFYTTDRFFQFQTGRRTRRGFSTQFGFPVPGSRFTRFFLGYGLSRTDFDLRRGADDTSLFGRPSSTQSQLTLGLTRNTQNHPLFPTQGSRQRINFEFNGGPLGGAGEFVKQTMEGSWWLPVGRLGGQGPGSPGIRTALGLSMRAGAIYGDPSRFPFDRFWMGGVQFGEGLRGYSETTITPQGFFPRGSPEILEGERLGDAFLKMTAEYAIRLNDNVSLSLFFDAGNIWDDHREVNPTQLVRGSGVGVQLVTPFGPIGLDYAYGFDKPTPGWQLHFRMGPGF